MQGIGTIKWTVIDDNLSAHTATLRWNSGRHTFTIPYVDATTLPFIRVYSNMVKTAEALRSKQLQQ